MKSIKRIEYIRELQEIQRLAEKTAAPVRMCSLDGLVQVDAKSYIGMYALDFSKPVVLESDDAAFHEKIRDIAKTVDPEDAAQ